MTTSKTANTLGTVPNLDKNLLHKNYIYYCTVSLSLQSPSRCDPGIIVVCGVHPVASEKGAASPRGNQVELRHLFTWLPIDALDSTIDWLIPR